jgi:hypothetical protein
MPIEVFSDFAAAIDSYEASMEAIAQLQCALSQRGIDPGPLDGLWGKKTQGALTKLAKEIGQKAMSAPVMAELGVDLAEIEAAKQYQADHKQERPAAYIPSAATQCGAGIFEVPGTAAAAAGGFLKRNWKWLVAAGVLTAGAIGVGAYVAMRGKDEGDEFGAIIPSNNPGFLYNNQYLQQTYGLRGRGRGLGRMRRRRGRRGMGLVTTDSIYTYQNPWLQQIYK